MNILEKAIVFATEAHEGQTRKLAKTPYILHPLEVAAIAATVTGDMSVMAAAVLHDTIEDCGITEQQIRDSFGDRVADLVVSETENRSLSGTAEQTWQKRKEDSIAVLKNSDDIGVKILWLSDKLSNMRSFYRMYIKNKDELFSGLHQKDPKVQGWYYKTIAGCLTDLSDTPAYKEYVELINKVFE